jgi:DNA-binding NtrC family response regulator
MTARKLIVVTHDPRLARQVTDLAGASYQVIFARSGESLGPALRADASVAVLIVDQAPNVPAADAVALLEVAREARAEVRRGLVSGYSDVGVIIRALHGGAAQFVLQRPIEPAELLAALAPRAVVAAAADRAGYAAA